MQSLRARFLLLIVLVAVPVALIDVYHASQDRLLLTNEANQDLARSGQTVVDKVSDLINASHELLTGLAVTSEVIGGDAAVCSRFLHEVGKRYTKYTNFSVVNHDKYLVCSSGPLAKPIHLTKSPNINEAFSSYSFSISPFKFGVLTKKPILVFSEPLFDNQNQFLGTINNGLNLEWLGKFISTVAIHESERIVVLDGKGIVLASHPERAYAIGSDIGSSNLARLAFKIKNGPAVFDDENGHNMIVAYATIPRIPNGAYVAAFAPANVLHNDILSGLYNRLIVLAFFVAATLFLGWISARMLLITPISRLVSLSTELSGGNLKARSDIRYGSTELNRLGQALDQMAEDIDIQTTALAEREEQFRSVFSNMIDTFYRTDLDGYVTMVSPSVRVLLGCEPEDLIGTKFAKLYADPDDREHFLTRLTENNGHLLNFETYLRRKDGSKVWVNTNAHYYYDKNGNVAGIEGTTRDMSVAKQRHEELKNSKAETETANKAKSEFMASMSHELRTPLNAVIGFAQLLQFDPNNPLSPSQKEHVKSIEVGGTHLLDLVNEILDLTTIEANQVVIVIDKVNANEVVGDCVNLFSGLAKDKGITIVDQFSDNDIQFINTDQQRLKQILTNLISNAIKYNKNGGKVVISGQQTDDKYLRLTIADTGMGIASSEKDNVFKMFHRHSSNAMIAQEGTGIGLSVTKLLVQRLGGKIGLESEEDVGSEFWFELPLSSNSTTLIWTDSVRTGVDAIDTDHQILVELSNQISHSGIEYEAVAEIVKKLFNYTLYHFKREEALMEVCGYPDFEKHLDGHLALIEKMNKLFQRWEQNPNEETLLRLRSFLQSWLFDHIIKVDKTITPYAKSHDREIRECLNNIKET